VCKKKLIVNNSVRYTKIIDLRKLGIFYINIWCKREHHKSKLGNYINSRFDSVIKFCS